MSKREARAREGAVIMTIEEITERLKEFEANPQMITESAYSPTATSYDDSRMPFSEIHLDYLRKHKKVDANSYLSNLKIMITKR